MKKILFLIPFIGFGQTQIGVNITGEEANDFSGNDITLSSDGSIVAIGAVFNDGNGLDSGHVRVYSNIAGIWTQIGSDINGEAAGDNFGSSVSLSSDGTILAVGATGNDGNGSNSGHVRVYRNISGIWTQIGADINGEAIDDSNGNDVSLSSDGTIVAIGARFNDGNGLDSGHVRVYRNISNSWLQIGTDINGEAAGDLFGYSVSLSSDGSSLAIGAPRNDGNGTSSGHVRVYRNISGVWTQIGVDIDGEAAGDWNGNDVSLSSDGSILAIGAVFNDGNSTDSGHVRVYRNISNSWTQIGTNINGEAAGDNSGYRVTLSSNGNILAIGAILNDGNGTDSGHVRVYQNISGIWTQIGIDIDGEIGNENGSSVCISSDGSIGAIGAIKNNGNGQNSGHVRVFSLASLLSSDTFVLDNFLIYPNPSIGLLNISLDNNLLLQKVAIYNQLGQLIKTAESNIINITELRQGAYYVEIITNQGKATKKIILK